MKVRICVLKVLRDLIKVNASQCTEIHRKYEIELNFVLDSKHE